MRRNDGIPREEMDYDQFLRLACPEFGLEWRKYRRRAARRRVEEHVRSLGLSGLSEYLERLRSSPEEADALPDVLRLTISRFFRERQRWEALAERVLPELLDSSGERVHAWSAGCCGGEEPYSLALLWRDRLAARHPTLRLEVLATDIDPASLERARRALYDRASLREVPADTLGRWFVEEEGGFRIRPELAQAVEFRPHNLRTDPPPVGMDLVLCRYLVFTYYRGDRRLRAARKLWDSLRPGGVLMIGRKEGLGPRELELFEPWPAAPGFYRKAVR